MRKLMLDHRERGLRRAQRWANVLGSVAGAAAAAAAGIQMAFGELQAVANALVIGAGVLGVLAGLCAWLLSDRLSGALENKVDQAVRAGQEISDELKRVSAHSGALEASLAAEMEERRALQERAGPRQIRPAQQEILLAALGRVDKSRPIHLTFASGPEPKAYCSRLYSVFTSAGHVVRVQDASHVFIAGNPKGVHVLVVSEPDGRQIADGLIEAGIARPDQVRDTGGRKVGEQISDCSIWISVEHKEPHI